MKSVDFNIESNRLINSIISILIKTPYFVCNQCYLRGSYANQTNNFKSDIDLLIVSRDFQEISISKRKELFYKTMNELECKIAIDVICLSDDEYLKLLKEERKMFYKERMIRIL